MSNTDRERLVLLLKSRECKSIRARSLSVWQIDGHSGEAIRCKLALIDAVRSLRPFIVYDESPQESELEGEWEKVGKQTWRMPAKFSSEKVLKWLHLGGWEMYAAQDVVEIETDLFRMSDEEIIDTMARNDIGFLISSFWDDDCWIVAINHADDK